MSTKEMTNKRLMELFAAYKRSTDLIVKLGEQDIRGYTGTDYIFEIERRYPGCILAVREVKRRLEQMHIPVYAIYVGAKSDVILIEIKANKRKVKEINQKLKKEIPTSGWLVVEHEHQEDGSEEQRSQVESA
jgi:sugar phosphate isomerase/epimerase